MTYKSNFARALESKAQKIKGDLLGTVANYKKCLEILENIKRVHKKDGSDFQNVLKNFEMPEGAELYREHVVFENQLRISAYPQKIYLDGYENDADKVEEMRKKNPERLINIYGLKTFYYKDADEIEQEIKETADKYRERIKKAEQNANNWDADVEKLKDAVKGLTDLLDNLGDENDYKLVQILKEAL